MRTRLLWALLITVMAGVIVASLTAALLPGGQTREAAGLPFYGQAPAVKLTDQWRRPFDGSSLKGKVWIADLIFTSCAGQCPQMTTQMASLQRQLPQEIQFVSMTVDPKRDTPEQLSRYAQAYGAQPGRWHFLTGEPAAIERLAKEGFRLSYAEDGTEEEPITHSVRFVLVDAQGAIRGFYEGTDPKAVARLRKDAQALGEENR